MFAKLEWFILTLLCADTLWADGQRLCPCKPTHLCQGNAPVEEQESCTDPGMVRCCEIIQGNHHEDVHKIIGKHLTEDQRIMAALENMLQNMNVNVRTPNNVGRYREDKSYSNNLNTKNNLGQIEKQLDGPLEKPTLGLGDIIGGGQKDDSDVSKLNYTKSLVDNSKVTSRDKVFVVYAEKPSKNNAPFNEDKFPPHIVMPSQDTSFVIQDNPTSSSVKISTGQNGDQLNVRQTNIYIPKRKPIHNLYSNKSLPRNSNKKIEDSENASSEFHDIRVEDVEMSTTRSPGLSPIHVPNITTEQININKLPFRSPPRRLVPRPGLVKSEENQHKGRNVLDLLKDQSKGRLGLKPIRIPGETTTNTNSSTLINSNKDALVEDINLRTINSLMKTNFSRQLADLKKPTSDIEYSHQDSTKSNILMGIMLMDKTQQEQIVNDVRNRSVVERGENKVSQRGRIRSRLHPTKYSTPDMSQDSVRLQELVKKLQPRRQLRTRPQVNTNGQSNETLTLQINENNDKTIEHNPQEQNNSPKAVSAFTSRRLRPRMKINTKSTNIMSPSDGSKLTQITAQSPNSQADFTEPKNISPVNSDGDLESSGSDNDPQQFSFQGEFLPPKRMESGFVPMLNGHNLQTIGPVPKDFAQLGFKKDADIIGLELPLSEPQVQIGARNMFNFNKIPQNVLLPPVVPDSQTSTFQSDFTEKEVPKLLPPLEDTSSDSELNKPKDYTQIHSELDSLKDRYEILLEKYTKALHTYNDSFKEFLS